MTAGTSENVELDRVATTWRPGSVVEHDTVGLASGREFAAMLDIASPVASLGDEIPPLWHWFLHLPTHARSALGEDGHPAGGPLMPPLAGRQRVFGGGRISVIRPLRVGDEVERRSSVRRVGAKHGRSGPLLLVTTRHVLSVAGRPCIEEEQDIIYRPPAARSTPLPDVPPAGSPLLSGPLCVVLAPDPVLLFRFSALTGNAHRIHYDRTYAREVERHPDRVVHGPLIALLLAEVPRRFLPDRSVRQLAWRAHHPTYVGQSIAHVAVVPTALRDGQLDVVASTSSRRKSVTATFELTESRVYQ